MNRPTLKSLLLTCLLAALGASLAPAAEESLPAREERAMKAALARVAPAVVRIETVGGLERVGQMLVGTGPTTGLVVSPQGHIVSSAFNFAQKPDSILITLPDGSRQTARLLATDHSRMLVLLKVDAAQPLAVPALVPEKEIRVGQWALAVGRTFELDQPNLSVGIVSAIGRIWGKAIQTDAKISPNNYGGPLVDISGRVLGVLVPMSPQGTGEMAGVEWYDSGIGFAVPMETVLRMLPRFEQGDLHAGLLGINLKGSDVYSDPPLIGAARAKGPAFKAGLRAGDKIVQVNDTPVASAAQFKHQMGPRYAGEKVKIAALRGEERIEREMELIDKIDPYVAPFLGLLPMRSAANEPVSVRYVYADSPAAAAGVQPGDQLQSINGVKVDRLETLRELLQTLAAGDEVALEVRRGETTLPLKAKLATLPESLPGELPPASKPSTAPAGGEEPKRGIVPIKLPEFKNECLAYVPETDAASGPRGLIVWLHAPGGFNAEELVGRWKPVCEKHGFVLLAPKAADPTRWQPTEVEFIRRALDEVRETYAVDPDRVIVHGQEGGGALAYIFGAMSNDVVRAIATVDAPLPRGAQLSEPDPAHPLAFYNAHSSQPPRGPAVEAGIKQLRELTFPVTVLPLGEKSRPLSAEELDQFVRWCDTLDRI